MYFCLVQVHIYIYKFKFPLALDTLCLWVRHHGMARPQVADERPPIWRVAVNKSNKKSRTADKGWSCNLGLDEALTTHRREKKNC